MPNWEPLRGGVEGEVVLPESPDFDRSSRPFNARFHDVLPTAIVRCATAHDVGETISFAHRHGLELAIRSGHHSFAGHSTTRGVLVDVTPMRSVSVSGDVATVGAGARLADVYGALQEHRLAIPAGTCPPVGVAGLTLGGGLGILGRKHGVTSDHLIGAEIVLADGRLLECDEHHHEDLFWALRGAGSGNFGVVTSLAFHTVSAPDVTDVHLAWPFSRAAELIDAWQGWAPSAPDELAASLKVTVTGDADPAVDVYAAFLGSESEAHDLLDELVVRSGTDPIASSLESGSFEDARRFWAQLGEAEHANPLESTARPTEPTWLAAKSEYFRRSLPAEAIQALLATFAVDRAPGKSRELDFMPWGGAYNRVPPDASAFVHRRERFLLKHAVVVAPSASSGEKEAASRQVADSWATVHPWGTGRVFQNFADPDLEDWARAYYGPNLDRLVRVKQRYDPEDVFRFDQSLRAP